MKWWLAIRDPNTVLASPLKSTAWETGVADRVAVLIGEFGNDLRDNLYLCEEVIIMLAYKEIAYADVVSMTRTEICELPFQSHAEQQRLKNWWFYHRSLAGNAAVDDDLGWSLVVGGGGGLSMLPM